MPSGPQALARCSTSNRPGNHRGDAETRRTFLASSVFPAASAVDRWFARWPIFTGFRLFRDSTQSKQRAPSASFSDLGVSAPPRFTQYLTLLFRSRPDKTSRMGPDDPRRRMSVGLGHHPRHRLRLAEPDGRTFIWRRLADTGQLVREEAHWKRKPPMPSGPQALARCSTSNRPGNHRGDAETRRTFLASSVFRLPPRSTVGLPDGRSSRAFVSSRIRRRASRERRARHSQTSASPRLRGSPKT